VEDALEEGAYFAGMAKNLAHDLGDPAERVRFSDPKVVREVAA
jgi:hypothetical protein